MCKVALGSSDRVCHERSARKLSLSGTCFDGSQGLEHLLKILMTRSRIDDTESQHRLTFMFSGCD